MDELWAKRTPNNSQMVSVHWADIRTVSRWDDETEEVRPARRLQTIGWLLYEGVDPEDPAFEIVVVAGTWDGEEKAWFDITCFPKMAFKKYERDING